MLSVCPPGGTGISARVLRGLDGARITQNARAPPIAVAQGGGVLRSVKAMRSRRVSGMTGLISNP